jgi:peptidoglycan glycosyltransferase
MNRSISRLFVVVLLLFAVLILFTSRWTVINRGSLQANSLNKIDSYASLKIKRGEILSADGKVLARSKAAKGSTWTRHYPFGPLFAQAIGYAIPDQSNEIGLEQYRNDALSGHLQTGLSSVFGSLHSATAGDDVSTNLSYKAQAQARSLLTARGYVGSVVAIVPQTGAVKVLYSSPSYNDNDLNNACKHESSSECSQFFTALEGRYPPGSTFKVVTATAALDSGKYTPDSEINAPGVLTVAGKPLHNDLAGDLGERTLTYALTNSINTVFAQVGLKVGGATMQKYMQRFGFYSTPSLDYPADEMTASGPRTSAGSLLPMTSPKVDLGRTAIGQANLLVTPLQMAEVAATVANGGVLMQPRLTSQVVNQDGQVVQRIKPAVYDRVMSSTTASDLTQMMRDVVEEGTGQAAQLDGLNVAGKTGTATVSEVGDLDDAWFIGFAPVKNPKIAVAVELSDIPDGYGGKYAAPIAAQVMKTLLAEGQ